MSADHPAADTKESLRTHFAPAERASPAALTNEIVSASNNAVIDALMSTVHGLLAVVNEQRQVLAINNSLLRFVGVEDPGQVLGLRVGEIVQCIHAHEMPGGCGTSEYCSSCGAAIAQVTSLHENRSVETLCALTIERGGAETNFCLRVRSTPFQLGGWRVLLVFLQDVTDWQHRATLERAFFHDLRNTLTALQGTSEMLSHSIVEGDGNGEAAVLASDVVRLCRRVTCEVDLQRCLSEASMTSYSIRRERHPVASLLGELRTICHHHPAGQGRHLHLLDAPDGLEVTTDGTVLLRIVLNMVVNALEATPAGATVRVWAEKHGDRVSFCVWSPTAIPGPVARRIFQRNFTTKEGTGRGMGTYAMKLLGEECLHGTVSFTSDVEHGTCFRLGLPANPPDASPVT